MGSSTVFIGSIPFDATEQQLSEIFATAGVVRALRLVSDKETGKPKGYGFCEYHDHYAAESAVRNLNGHELSGRQLRVGFAEDHQQTREADFRRGGGGGAGGDGDRWRGRDRERERDRDRDRDRRPPERDGPRFPGGPGLAGSKPVGAAAAATAAGSMASMLGGPPAPGPTQGRVNSVLGGMSPLQLFELMSQMRNHIQQNPGQARQTLISNPQLTKALFQAQILLGMVKPPPGTGGAPPQYAPPPGGAAQPPLLAPPPAASQPPAIMAAPAGPAQFPGGGMQPLYNMGSAGQPPAFNVQGPPVQVIAIDGGAQGMQYVVQPPQPVLNMPPLHPPLHPSHRHPLQALCQWTNKPSYRK